MNLAYVPIAPAVTAPAADPDRSALIQAVIDAQLKLYARTGADAPWIGYFAKEASSGETVGSCSFVGPPVDGEVEIAYFTFPGGEGRGIAGAMAAKLVEEAREHGASAAVAHTLRETNASTRILERLGFTIAGDAVDDDAGPVWRWRLALS